MAEYTTVEINYGEGSIVAQVELTYRWYVPGNDPWRKVAGPSNSIPASGEWENRAIGGSTSEVRMYTTTDGLAIKLINFRRITVGSTGDGEFYPSGYLIPEFSPISWKVLSIRR